MASPFSLEFARSRTECVLQPFFTVMPLEKITSVAGRGVYVPGSDIDTDRIIPARFMKCVTLTVSASILLRCPSRPGRKPEGASAQRSAFLGGGHPHFRDQLRLWQFARARAAGAEQGGLRAVIAQSFAEIFFGNCATLGIPCVIATAADIEALGAAVNADLLSRSRSTWPLAKSATAAKRSR